jgi:hypothetical protein
MRMVGEVVFPTFQSNNGLGEGKTNVPSFAWQKVFGRLVLPHKRGLRATRHQQRRCAKLRCAEANALAHGAATLRMHVRLGLFSRDVPALSPIPPLAPPPFHDSISRSASPAPSPATPHQATATDALVLPLSESGISFCPCPPFYLGSDSPDSPAATAGVLPPLLGCTMRHELSDRASDAWRGP